MQLRTLDAVVIIGYLLLMLLIGFWGSKKTKSMEDYVVAGRGLGFGTLFPCMCALLLGGGCTLGGVGLGYTTGLSGVWFLIALACGCAALTVIAPKVSRLRIYTISEMLELRYGKASKMFGAVIVAIYLVALATVQVVSIGAILSTLFGWDVKIAMLIGGGIALIYSWIGGMFAVTITDVFQWVFMTVGVFFMLFPTSLSQAGGFANLTATLDPSYFNFTAIGGGGILAYFLLYTLGSPVDQSGWQRLFTAKNKKVAVSGTLAASGYAVLWGFAIVIIGMCAAVIMPGIENSDSIFTLMAVQMLPAGAAGFVLAGALSAVMSTLSGPFLAASTVIINDFVIPSCKTKPEDKKVLHWTRLCMAISGLVGLAIAFWLQEVLVALDFAYEILASSVVVPVFAGLFWKRANSKGAFAAIVAGLVGMIIGMIIWGISSLYPILLGMGASLIAMIAVSLATPAESEKWDRLFSRTVEDTPEMTAQ